VHVRVDQTREQDLVSAELDDRVAVEAGVERLDGRDPPVTYADATGDLAARGDDPGCAEHQVEPAHRTARRHTCDR